VTNLEDAAKEEAPKVWEDNPNGNTAFRLMFGDQGATDAVFAKSPSGDFIKDCIASVTSGGWKRV